MTFYESHEGSSRSTYIPGRDEAVDEVMREWEHRLNLLNYIFLISISGLLTANFVFFIFKCMFFFL